MHHTLLFVLTLLFAVILLVVLAGKLRIAYPIFLVVAGLVISLIPGAPKIHLDPDLIFLIFLPPLLYEAAWNTSWNDFWKWRRPVAMLGFGLVFFTSAGVAYAASSYLPGFTLALGFLLGGIVSPPDAVAATSVLKGMHIPKRVTTILEGESLVNDASSLIVFRFALAAVLTGTFSMQEATVQFFLVSGMGIITGLVGAHILYAIHRFLPTNAAIDSALSLMTPYILFVAAEHYHFSGVLAVVSGGLFMSFRSHEIYRTGNSRMTMMSVWSTLVFIMNAMVFILIGLELPEIVEGLGEQSIHDGIHYGLMISGAVILLRFIWVYIVHAPKKINSPTDNDPSLGWKGSLVLSWAGMRGVVSLATALSIPMVLNDGTAFPQRSMILLITFVVIFVTLVFQGLTLPFLIKLIKLEEIDALVPEAEEQAGIQLRLDHVALKILQEKYPEEIGKNEFVSMLKTNLEHEVATAENQLVSLEHHDTEKEQLEVYHRILLDIYALQRKELFRLRKEKLFSDHEIRKAELQVDINEVKITGTGTH